MKNKSQKTQYRQGDVLIERVASIPKTTTPVPTENGRIILAHGEVTGHSHSLAECDGTLTQESGITYLEIKTALAMLTHQEHGTVEIPKGTYRVTRQREYSPEAIRNVVD